MEPIEKEQEKSFQKTYGPFVSYSYLMFDRVGDNLLEQVAKVRLVLQKLFERLNILVDEKKLKSPEDYLKASDLFKKWKDLEKEREDLDEKHLHYVGDGLMAGHMAFARAKVEDMLQLLPRYMALLKELHSPSWRNQSFTTVPSPISVEDMH